MTFVLATAWPEFAVFATDRRVRLKGEHLELVATEDGHEKLGQCADGLWSASGDLAFHRELTAVLGSVVADAVPDVLAKRGPPFFERLERTAPTAWVQTMRQQQRVLLVGPNVTGFVARELRWDGTAADDEPGHCCTRAVKPVGLPQDMLDEAIGRFHADIAGRRVETALARTHELFREVYDYLGAEGSVSPTYDVGVLMGGRRLSFARDVRHIYSTEQDGSTKSSSAHNPQGSMAPTPSTSSFYTSASGGATSGHMWCSIISGGAGTAYRPDGSTLALPFSNNVGAYPSVKP